MSLTWIKVFTLSTKIMASAAGKKMSKKKASALMILAVLSYVLIFIIRRHPIVLALCGAAWIVSCIVIAALHKDFPEEVRERVIAAGEGPSSPEEEAGEEEDDPGAALPIEQTEDDDHDDEDEPPSKHPLLALCEHLTGTASGVHVNALVTHLNKPDATTPITADDVVATLDHLGVPTRRGVRGFKGGILDGEIGVARGVYRADLEAAIRRLSPTAPKDPSESRATPSNPDLTCDVAGAATAVAGDVAAPATAQKGHFDTGLTITPAGGQS